MSMDIKESDWKLFKTFHAVAMGRFFEKAVTDLQPVLADAQQPAKDRFWDAMEMGAKFRKEAQFLFDDFRKSTAIMMLAAMVRRGFITNSELTSFSSETQSKVENFLSIERR